MEEQFFEPDISLIGFGNDTLDISKKACKIMKNSDILTWNLNVCYHELSNYNLRLYVDIDSNKLDEIKTKNEYKNLLNIVKNREPLRLVLICADSCFDLDFFQEVKNNSETTILFTKNENETLIKEATKIVDAVFVGDNCYDAAIEIIDASYRTGLICIDELDFRSLFANAGVFKIKTIKPFVSSVLHKNYIKGLVANSKILYFGLLAPFACPLAEVYEYIRILRKFNKNALTLYSIGITEERMQLSIIYN